MYKDDLIEDDLIKKLFEYKNSKKKKWREVAEELGYTRGYVSKIIQESYPLTRECKEKLRWFLNAR